MFKAKAYKPEQLDILFRIIDAEINTALKKENQIIGVAQRALARSVKSSKKDDVYNQAYKIATSKAHIEGFGLIQEAVKNIKMNKIDAVASRSGPPAELFQDFNTLCTAGALTKLDSLIKFGNKNIAEMFDKKVLPSIRNPATMDPEIQKSFTTTSFTDDELQPVFQEVVDGFMDGDAGPLEALIGHPITMQESAPMVSPSYNQGGAAPQGAYIPNPVFVGTDVATHNDLFTPNDIPEFGRDNWAAILKDVNDAIA